MSAFKILRAEKGSTYKTKYGELVAYEVDFEGEQGTGTAQLSQKPETPAPQPNEVIDATLENTPFGPKLKKVPPTSVAPGVSGQARAPGERDSIIRQHSQHMAVLWLATLQKEGSKADEAQLLHWIDFFDRNAKEVWSS